MSNSIPILHEVSAYMTPTDNAFMALADLAVESWRFAEDFRRLLSKLDAGEQGRFTNKLLYFRNRLDACLASADLKCVSLEGHPYEMGIPAHILNLEEYSPADELIIDQMLEPVIMGPDGVVKAGKATVVRTAAI